MSVRYERLPNPAARWHPLADIFPWIEGAAFNELVEDVRRNGVLEPIVMFEGMILDGRNRYMAAREAGIEYPLTDYTGDDPLGFVIAMNLKRRHLTESQRGMVHARLAKLPKGRPDENTAIAAITQEQASRLLNVSVDTGQRARQVIERGTPELIAAVESGDVAVSLAAQIAREPLPVQQEIVARGPAEIKAAYKAIRATELETSRTARIEKIEAISAGNTDLDTSRRYPIILADPPWRYENPPIGATNRAIENHYPTMDLAEICALPVSEIAADDALLYLWATAPKLPECLRVIEAWGFEYRTHIVWVKDKIGMGYHARNQHELLLIAKRGTMPPPKAGEQPSSVIEAAREGHSAKPAIFAETIERLYPGVGKIELFCRAPREGWAVWGNQAGALADAA